MIVLGKESRLSEAQVLARAVDYFGPDGVGLELTSQDAATVQLEGGGGYVRVRAQPQNGSDQTTVEIESREWEYNAEKFLVEI